ncbi:hypothetical protein AB0J72_26645 [Dactylosporangium sp. NPDC049742]
MRYLTRRFAAAAADRWVNFGVAGDEYLDLVRSRRTGPSAF